MSNQYIQTLISNNAVLVHCSSESILVGSIDTISLGPLEKLQKAITGDLVISCSTISSGDTMICQNTNHIKNYTGPIGIIVSPKINCSITQANSSDSGSTPEIRENSRLNRQICSPAELDEAIKNRTNYNEIFVHTYRVIGIFIRPPMIFNIRGAQVAFTDKEIYSVFYPYDFYRLNYGDFTKLIYDESSSSFYETKKYSVSEIYT